MWLEMLGVAPVYLPFRPERGGVPDPADARARITPRTRAIVLVTPNNPTGAIYPPETIHAFHDLAREAGVALLLDETYRDFLPGEAPPHGLFARPGWDETLIHLYSFSKVYSLTGYRVGALVAAERLLAEVAKAADCVAICAPAIAQEAALFGLQHGSPTFRADKRRLVLERIARFRAVFARNTLAYALISAGAFFAYVRHPFAGVPAAAIARRLVEEENVLCLPGSAFGPDQDDYLRFALANIDGDAMAALGDRLEASQRLRCLTATAGSAVSKRLRSRPSMGVSVRPSSASSAATAPDAGPRQKPWPLKPKACTRPGVVRLGQSTGRWSGVQPSTPLQKRITARSATHGMMSMVRASVVRLSSAWTLPKPTSRSAVPLRPPKMTLPRGIWRA